MLIRAKSLLQSEIQRSPSELGQIGDIFWDPCSWFARTAFVSFCSSEDETGRESFFVDLSSLSLLVHSEDARVLRFLLPSDLRSGNDGDGGGHQSLASLNALLGYSLFSSTNGSISASIEDLMIELDDWYIPFLVVRAKNYVPGEARIVNTDLIEGIDWGSRRLDFAMDEHEYGNCPVFESLLLDSEKTCK